jgi:hypothetical protein
MTLDTLAPLPCTRCGHGIPVTSMAVGIVGGDQYHPDCYELTLSWGERIQRWLWRQRLRLRYGPTPPCSAFLSSRGAA